MKKEIYISDHPLYQIWQSMKYRCRTNYKGYEKIAVCERWKNSFYAFLDDMGPRPPGYQIDRIDNTKGYYKENCRWATPRENNNNRSDNVKITYQGYTLSCSQWARVLGTHRNNITERKRKGYKTPEDILFGLQSRKTANKPLSKEEIYKRLHLK